MICYLVKVWSAIGLRVALSAVCVLLWAQVGHAAAPPNIVLIMADDMGYECVSANGSTTYSTPHLDRLAADGMRFRHAHSQPICTPSRVQIMTGIYNERNYIRFGILDPQATTFGHLLRKAGYATCVAGKWQLEGGMQAPDLFGFDEHCLWQLNRRPSRYPNPGLEVNGQQKDYTDGAYGPDIVTDYIVDFIGRHQDQPFFVYYPMILPHWPFEPTPDSEDWDPQAEGLLRGHGELKYFKDMVHYTDKMVGKVVAQLDRLGLRDNTLVIFTADNGTYVKIKSYIGDRAVQGGKGLTTDNGTHVPMIARWPARIRTGQVSNALIDFSDILPTLSEVGGAPVPDRIDGRSFFPVLTGQKDSARDWIYCWYERNGRVNRASQHVRDRQYKRYADGRFFDLIADPTEQANLMVSELSSEQEVAELKLSKALAEVLERSEQTEAVKQERKASKDE